MYLSFESLDPFFRVSKQGPCFTAIEEEGEKKKTCPDKQRGERQFVEMTICIPTDPEGVYMGG